jgi:hypothetical protein
VPGFTAPRCRQSYKLVYFWRNDAGPSPILLELFCFGKEETEEGHVSLKKTQSFAFLGTDLPFRRGLVRTLPGNAFIRDLWVNATGVFLLTFQASISVGP